MKTRMHSKAKVRSASARRNTRSTGKLLAVACVTAICGSNHWAGAAQTWDPAATGGSGGTGPWDTTSPDWDNAVAGSTGAVWANTTSSNAYFGGTAGTVTVVSTGINAGNVGTFATNGYTVQGPTASTGTIILGGTGFTTELLTGVSTIVTAPLAGSAGADFSGVGQNTSTLTLGGNNSYTGTTQISESTINLPVLALSGTNSSVGSSGNVTLVNNSSTAYAYYTGGGATTDRLWQFGGTTTVAGTGLIANNGTGALILEATGSAETGSAGPRKFQLTGTTTAAAFISVFAETITDMAAGSGSLTSGTFSGGQWELTGTNTYTGGTTISSSAATVDITNATTTSSSLGAGSLTFSSGGTLSTVAGLTGGLNFSNEINITAANTGQAKISNLEALGAANTFNISGLIIGTGNLKISTPGISSYGGIEISDDSNSFTGTFATGAGFIQYTSVANYGTNSSLGAGSTTAATSGIYIQNGGSTVTFQYIGANADSTSRPIVLQASVGPLNLDSSGANATSSLQYLATAPLRSGGTSTTNNTESLYLTGTNTGNNVLAQPIDDAAAYTTGTAPTQITYPSGVTSLYKTLAGTWIVTGASTYTGATNISGGTLEIDASDAAGALTGVTPSSTASIAGSATIALTGGTLHLLNTSAAGPVTMLSTTANVTVPETGATILLDLAGNTQTVNTFYVSNGTNAGFQAAGTYGSATYFADLPGGTPTLTAQQSTDEAYFGTSDGAFVVTNTPEPMALSLLSVGAFGFLGRRRRRITVKA